MAKVAAAPPKMAAKKVTKPGKPATGKKADLTKAHSKPGDNLVATNEGLKSQLEEVFRRKKALDKATAAAREENGRYRNAVKIAKDLGKHLGVEASHILETVRLKGMEPEDIDRNTAIMNKLCVLANIPIGGSLGQWLGEDGSTKSVATLIEDGQIEPPLPGDKAFAAGKQFDDNPFKSGAKEHKVWRTAWLEAQVAAGKVDHDDFEERATH